MELSPELRALLEQKVYGHVVTQNRDGSPQVTMVWMDVHDGKAAFNTNSARQKARNLKRNPRVMVSVQSPDNPQQYALLVGTATVTEAGAVEHINAISNKFTGHDYANFQPGEVRVSVDIDLEEVRGAGPWVTPRA